MKVSKSFVLSLLVAVSVVSFASDASACWFTCRWFGGCRQSYSRCCRYSSQGQTCAPVRAGNADVPTLPSVKQSASPCAGGTCGTRSYVGGTCASGRCGTVAPSTVQNGGFSSCASGRRGASSCYGGRCSLQGASAETANVENGASLESQFVELVNAARRESGLAPLTLCDDLKAGCEATATQNARLGAPGHYGYNSAVELSTPGATPAAAVNCFRTAGRFSHWPSLVNARYTKISVGTRTGWNGRFWAVQVW